MKTTALGPGPSSEWTLVREMVESLDRWFEREQFASYDWWDIWATPFGRWAKKTFATQPLIGSLGVIPLMLLDLIHPQGRRWFAQKRSFPICHAQIGLGYLNLFNATGNNAYLHKAGTLVQPLLDMASPQVAGLGWGMKHDWMTVAGMIPKDTPCNTQTAYAYEFFAGLFDLTKNEQYTFYLDRIAMHVASDFPEWQDGERLACAYSTKDTRRVVNANSYRMMMLLDAGTRFKKPRYHEKGVATLKYVLSKQHADGSWPYAEDQEFVDTYHTCFVLKNLVKSRRFVPNMKQEVDSAIERGLAYYRTNLLDDEGYPKPFAVAPRMVLHTHDSYDIAESIGVFVELHGEEEMVRSLVSFAARRLRTEAGWYKFRLYGPVPLKGIPYLRYANAAMFLALTKLFLKLHHSDAHGSTDR